MKKSLAVFSPVIVTAFLVVWPGSTHAQGQPQKPEQPAQPLTFYNQGVVKDVDAKKMTIDVETKKDTVTTFKLAPKVFITKTAIPLKPSEIYEGSFVQLAYVKEGEAMVANRVYLYDEPPGGAKASFKGMVKTYNGDTKTFEMEVDKDTIKTFVLNESSQVGVMGSAPMGVGRYVIVEPASSQTEILFVNLMLVYDDKPEE